MPDANLHPVMQAAPSPFMPYAADCRPGERIVAGKVYVYDLDALNLHLAYEARDNAPADLSVLGELELAMLDGAAGRIWADTCGMDDELSGRVEDEQRRRALAGEAAA